jgi:glycogen debranching enzyme
MDFARRDTGLCTLLAGRPWPLGATVVHGGPLDGLQHGLQEDAAGGVNIAVFSQHATRIELCLFDDEGRHELQRLTLPGRSGDVFHGFLPGAGAGRVYGLRAHGPWRPDRGHRFNPHKLLLDPWAREIVPPASGFDWNGPHFGAERDHPQHLDTRDNAAFAHKARVVDEQARLSPLHRAAAGGAPGRASGMAPGSGTHTGARTDADTLIYELHVRGFTRRMPGVPEALRGTYAGLASDAAIAHLQALGVSAVCLLPVQQHLDEAHLAAKGLVNYWGYNTLGFFCPEPRYAAAASGEGVRAEFRAMVQRLHAAGIEVLLDVVYNHTPEGDERGPTLSWRGLDNASCYRLPEHDKQHFENWTGCGNTLDIRHPRMLQMVMDSLRHWVQHYGIDGFRFDLAPVLGRGDHGFDRNGPFFKTLLQDPVLQGLRWIAEPWDVGPSGYQLGQFPRGWQEWNDRFRDTTRAFWLGGDCTRGEFALRLAGSSDLYQPRQRSPLESINYIVSHDGFTLADLVSYDLRHNEANGEGNRDGHGHNLSWNCGWEGPTTDPEVRARRARLQRALLASLLLSQGTPMLAAGDELGHSQQGNNNPYCQDNELTWIDWSSADAALLEYTTHVIALRRRLLPLAPRWYTACPTPEAVPTWPGCAAPASRWRRSTGTTACRASSGPGSEPPGAAVRPCCC